MKYFLIKHTSASVRAHKEEYKGKFSIVLGKKSSLKYVGQSLNRMSTVIQHGSDPVPLKIIDILYQNENVPIKKFYKQMQLSKETVIEDPRRIIQFLLS